MVNDLLDAISVQLYKKFGDSYKYYVEDVQQNLTKPCFAIGTVSNRKRSRSPVLYDRTVPVVIYYFHDDKRNLKRACNAIAEEVTECLEYLPMLGKVLMGYNFNWNMVEDDVMAIYVTYQFTSINVEDVDKMADLSTVDVNYS